MLGVRFPSLTPSFFFNFSRTLASSSLDVLKRPSAGSSARPGASQCQSATHLVLPDLAVSLRIRTRSSADVSADGKWMGYRSDQSAQLEIYLPAISWARSDRAVSCGWQPPNAPVHDPTGRHISGSVVFERAQRRGGRPGCPRPRSDAGCLIRSDPRRRVLATRRTNKTWDPLLPEDLWLRRSPHLHPAPRHAVRCWNDLFPNRGHGGRDETPRTWRRSSGWSSGVKQARSTSTICRTSTEKRWPPRAAPARARFAGVSTPLAWTEVHEGVRGGLKLEDFTLRSIFALVDRVSDL